MTAITLLTVQNTTRVKDVLLIEPSMVRAQIEAVLEDIPPNAIKTGALGNETIIRAVADSIRHLHIPLVVDPVMISKHDKALLDQHSIDALKTELLPLATLVTPNIHEAESLSGHTIENFEEMKTAAKKIKGLGMSAVLIKGGHFKFAEADAIDLFWDGVEFECFRSPRILSTNTHGTGCTYSAAITANLAKGLDLKPAIDLSKKFIQLAIEKADKIGHGYGPVNHFVLP